MSKQQIHCYLVEQSESKEIRSRLAKVQAPKLQEGDVLVRVECSSLNYKDAMAATGNPGIVKSFPHIPGIDAVGVVETSRDSRFEVGDQVIATGHELGVERWGAWASHVVAPSDWLVQLPAGLSAIEAMTLGTAGFTAAQCVAAIVDHGCKTDDGPIIVSGATGGVGSIAVMLLAHLGYQIVAVTGKQDRHAWLKEIGASEVTGRDSLDSDAKRPLLKGEFAAGIDTVGGKVLATMLKKIQHRGCVACCGVTGGAELPTTVFPFILRGVALYGIDSAWCPDDLRTDIWDRLATDWKLPRLLDAKVDLTLTTVDAAINAILEGKFAGRGVIRIAE
ncbi:YhdH/YhfP family quinone oxidoreductase [bacterium]|jgi:acrylyl-CoA reductase (NADPH)|nr:YhdH/YhfP family quinone oxidoreductase [Planctomicrobium sp.]MDB4802799.1 YhdH/YhfP family quinone oxidoreductase [bacterium]